MYRMSAILVLGTHRPSTAGDEDEFANSQERDCRVDALAGNDLLGASALDRSAIGLKKSGIEKVCVVTNEAGMAWSLDIQFKSAESLNGRWLAAGRMLEECARQKVDAVLLAELGPYVEFDLAAALEFHRAKQQIATPLYDDQGALGWWIVDPLRLARNFPLPPREDELPETPIPFFVAGYVNRLSNAQDLRRLVVDAFERRCGLRPRGREVRPGVWLDEGARIDKSARLVAPVYIGSDTSVEAGAVITRFSNIERNCLVDEGTVVANSSVLQNTTVGRDLDVCTAVVDGADFIDIARDVSVRIRDPRLISGAVSERVRASRRLPEMDDVELPQAQPEVEYSYLSRAAGRLLEVFKGEV